ncbi:hypothetical protein JOF41_004295 [Saccharothrix coeruleofusca]|uniref:immunity 49 family protein n=1 Tax=Saccharothrix coeruleofusca TaxID=33919 RepID=UPI001AE811C2|nr:immunity 49 family protein [Saccharothrix coeruleofusca]MBP2338117.1 hypothetical protein [Saccharothrix coeruleofusca]
MLEVSRHTTYAEDAVEALDRLDDDVRRGVEMVGGYTGRLNLLFMSAVDRVGHQAVVDPRAEARESWLGLVFALDVGMAIFTVASAEKGSDLTCRIGEQEYLLTATGPVSYASPQNWLTTLWLAITARDGGALQHLANVPAEALGAGTAPEYLHDMVRMFQLFLHREPGVEAALNAALRNSDPAQLPEGIRDYTTHISFPIMTLFHHLLQEGNEQQFNDALAEALQQHKTYWSTDDEREESPLGYIALGPLALAAMAHDTGTQITVTSDYLPTGLLNGTTRIENA